MTMTLSERRAYYGDRHVRERIDEFFGGSVPEQSSAIYFAAGTDAVSNHRRALPLEEMPSWLEQGAEVNRSLWDRESLIAHLDIEYVNFDQPALPYLNPDRAFALQEPVAEAVEKILGACGIRPLHLLSGRGHHYLWKISQRSKAFAQLAAFGHVPASLQRHYATMRSPTGDTVSAMLGAAFAGLGLVIEFVANQIKTASAAKCEIPVELGAIETGAGADGRELVSVDITEYADPLSARVVRVPFSLYLKPAQQRGALGDQVVEKLPPMFMLPLGRMSVGEGIQRMRDPASVAQFARIAPGEIPDASRPMKRLISAYRRSPLAAFHRDFYSQQHDARSLWPQTYDATSFDVLPPCVRFMIEHPNDLLLRPACVQRVVRVFLALGWHPRHIAGLLRSKYERDYGWGDQWRGYDPATRADFYARVFSGLFATGADDLVDFNCQSAREENLCLVSDCQENLLRYRKSLLDRRHYERMGHWPFHRLFLPEEHL
jgi:hypothetical protein